jgi:hypothetical protein
MDDLPPGLAGLFDAARRAAATARVDQTGHDARDA